MYGHLARTCSLHQHCCLSTRRASNTCPKLGLTPKQAGMIASLFNGSHAFLMLPEPVSWQLAQLCTADTLFAPGLMTEQAMSMVTWHVQLSPSALPHMHQYGGHDVASALCMPPAFPTRASIKLQHMSWHCRAAVAYELQATQMHMPRTDCWTAGLLGE